MVRGVRLWMAFGCLVCGAFLVFLYGSDALVPGLYQPAIPPDHKPSGHQKQQQHQQQHLQRQEELPNIDNRPLTKATKPPPKSTKKATTTTTTTTPTTTARTVTIIRIPDTATLRRMSHVDLHKLYHSYINSPQVPCSAVERMGKIKDGGWEICDDPLYRPPNRKDCLVYSFGINNDFSYDDDIAEYGCEVHAFDPSMLQTSDHLRGERVHFHKLGIGNRDNFKLNTMNAGVWTLHTLKGFRSMLGHEIGKRRIDIVKMDVEGHELESLTKALEDGSLADVRQLCFETHVTWTANDASKEEYIKFLELLRGVYEAGFRIYMTHRNYVWSAFLSQLTGKERAHCHEVHTVNINLRQKLPPQPPGRNPVAANNHKGTPNSRKEVEF